MTLSPAPIAPFRISRYWISYQGNRVHWKLSVSSSTIVRFCASTRWFPWLRVGLKFYVPRWTGPGLGCISSSKSGVVRIGFSGLCAAYWRRCISGCLHCFRRTRNCSYQLRCSSHCFLLALISFTSRSTSLTVSCLYISIHLLPSYCAF